MSLSERERWQPPPPQMSEVSAVIIASAVLMQKLGRRLGIVAHVLLTICLATLFAMRGDLYLASGVGCIIIGLGLALLRKKLPASMKGTHMAMSGMFFVFDFAAAFLLVHAW